MTSRRVSRIPNTIPAEAAALDLLDPFLEHGGAECRPAAGCGREDVALRHHFRLEERRLIQQVITVGIVASDLDGEEIRAPGQAFGQVNLIHAIETVRTTRRAVGEELADVIGYSFALANELGLDISSAIRAKMVKNAEKYPAEKYRGRYERPKN